MLTFSIEKNNKIVFANTLKPGPYPQSNGSMTDYIGAQKRIILFSHPDENLVEIKASELGLHTDDLIRVVIPFKDLTHIKTLHKGESFDLPFTSKFGEAIMHFSVT